jgi:hypothetical protein
MLIIIARHHQPFPSLAARMNVGNVIKNLAHISIYLKN